ncbi:MAG: glycosidase [Phycisphaerales bacterium]|nr:glycosidase [Phycisphaerales bacterium]
MSSVPIEAKSDRVIEPLRVVLKPKELFNEGRDVDIVMSRASQLPVWAIGPFQRPPEAQPIISPDVLTTFACPMREESVRWEALHAFNPAAVVKDGKVYLLYRAEDDFGAMVISGHTSRLGLAVSDDGLLFTRFPTPVLFPDHDGQKSTEWDGGCEDPRVCEMPDGQFLLTYTQWDRRVPRLAVATSPDLINWTKHGPAFGQVHGAKYYELHSKAGSVVCRREGDRLIAAMINEKYWMYWGEHVVRLAWSMDLLNWNMVEDADGNPVPVMEKRPGMFDSPLVEPGPPAVLTDHGIVLIYNARNDGDHDHHDLSPDAYSAGQALFDANDPAKLIGRLDQPFLQPAMPFEQRGQYGAGTTFTEGLVRHRGQWMLYYGCADSLVAVAVSDKSDETLGR